MYALLNDSDQLVAGAPIEIYRNSRAITLPDGLQLPGNWMQLLTTSEKQALHIFILTTIGFDTTRFIATGASTFTFDGTQITETILFAPKSEPQGLDAYKIQAYIVVDAEAVNRIDAAENIPTAIEDYTDDPDGKDRADNRRNNKAKKNDPISDADDNLFDHIDKVYDGADLIRDGVEAAVDYDAVDLILSGLSTNANWPTWTPI